MPENQGKAILKAQAKAMPGARASWVRGAPHLVHDDAKAEHVHFLVVLVAADKLGAHVHQRAHLRWASMWMHGHSCAASASWETFMCHLSPMDIHVPPQPHGKHPCATSASWETCRLSHVPPQPHGKHACTTSASWASQASRAPHVLLSI